MPGAGSAYLCRQYKCSSAKTNLTGDKNDIERAFYPPTGSYLIFAL